MTPSLMARCPRSFGHSLMVAGLLSCAMLPRESSAGTNFLQAVLAQPILGPDLSWEEVQAYTESHVETLPAFDSVKAWEKYKKSKGREVLDQVVFRGEARSWRKLPTHVEWLETIPGGPGYHIRKLRYEAVPGLWIPALLYEPDNLSGPAPVVLNVNGHDGEGKAAPYKQLRCINQARHGMLALNTEWLGMGQLRGDDNAHYRLNQLNLCGTSGQAVFYLAMQRALDILLEHPHADPDRVAVAGLSGGGWQTIFISSLDPRVTLANPVAGYSSFRTRARFPSDLGDSEQTPTDLASVADYTHLTAFLAPRPALLTFNAKDNCCFAADHALVPLRDAAAPIYALYGRQEALRTHVNHVPGNHNFGEDNRRALYDMLDDFFFTHEPRFHGLEMIPETELKSADELNVPLPDDNHTLHSLALGLSESLPNKAALPRWRWRVRSWQERNRERLQELVRAKPYRAYPERVRQETHGDLETNLWKLRLRKDWTLPVVDLSPAKAKDTVILLHDQGRRALAEVAARHLREGRRVLAVDLFYMGESKINSRDFLYALLLASVGDRPLGLQASQLAAVARWAGSPTSAGTVTLHAIGPRSSLMALVGAALEERVDGLILEGSLGSLREILERNWAVNQYPELFCFGLFESFDLLQLAALVAPRPVTFPDPSDRVQTQLAPLFDWYRLLGSDHRPWREDAGSLAVPSK